MLRVSDDGRPADMTLLLLAFAVPMVVMVPIAGRIVDGHDSRFVLVATSLVQAAAAVGLAFVHGLAATVALVCVLQAGQSVSGPAWSALIPRIVGDRLTGRAVGVGQALSGVAMFAGSAAGGVLVGWRGDRVALLVDAATFAVLAVVALAVRTRRRPGGPSGSAEPATGSAVGIQAILADDLLRVLVPGLWLFTLAAEAVNVVEVFLVTDEVGLGPSAYGTVLAVQGGGAIAGAWLASRIGSDPRRVVAVVLGTAGIGGSCVLMGLATGVVVLVIGGAGCGLAAGLLNAAVSTLVVTRSAEEVRGRVFVVAGVICVLLAGFLGLRVRTRRTGGKDSFAEAVSN